MKQPGHAIRLVTGVLQGRLVGEADWLKVFEIANRGWLVPALHVAIRRAGQLDTVPPHVRAYLSLLHERNRARNLRLREQLFEAIGALNGQGIHPILIKGAINLFTADSDDLGARMQSDLDLSIAPFEMAGAKSALLALGYQDVGHGGAMSRSDDVGVIELHDRPSARSAKYLSGDDFRASLKVARHGAVARIPSATSQALHLIVHDMIKEADYWSMRIDLRHLHDLAFLARSSEGFNWQQLSGALADRTARAALILQAAALEDLFDVEIPPDLRPGWSARLKHVARLLRASGGLFGSVARLVGDVSNGLQRMEGHDWKGGANFTRQVYRRLTAPSKGSRL